MLRRLLVPLADVTGWVEGLWSLIWRPTEDEEEDREQLDRAHGAVLVTVVCLALIFGGGGLAYFGVMRVVDGGWGSVLRGGGQVIGGLVAIVLGGHFVPRWTDRWTRPILPSGDE